MVELFDAARKDGLKVAVCSASTKIAVQYALQNVLGEDRFFSLDAFLAGDDVAEKKPNPAIYKVCVALDRGHYMALSVRCSS